MTDELYQLTGQLNGHIRKCALAGLVVTGDIKDSPSHIGGESPYPIATYKVTIAPHNIEL